VVLPPAFFIVATGILISSWLWLRGSFSFWQALALFPLVYALAGATGAAIVIALKWILMGKYRPCEKPLWSSFVWRTEFLTALHENFSDLFLTDLLRGTPLLCWFFRALGTKVGKRVYMDTTCLTEFDLIEIGDDVALDRDCTLQTHLFEDRVMKMSRVTVGSGSSVGMLSLVLYDTEMGEGSTLGSLSLLMKREFLPPRTRWHGIPARRA
jgi:non-ribosomal peptide synthetase-like protein